MVVENERFTLREKRQYMPPSISSQLAAINAWMLSNVSRNYTPAANKLQRLSGVAGEFENSEPHYNSYQPLDKQEKLEPQPNMRKKNYARELEEQGEIRNRPRTKRLFQSFEAIANATSPKFSSEEIEHVAELLTNVLALAMLDNQANKTARKNERIPEIVNQAFLKATTQVEMLLTLQPQELANIHSFVARMEETAGETLMLPHPTFFHRKTTRKDIELILGKRARVTALMQEVASLRYLQTTDSQRQAQLLGLMGMLEEFRAGEDIRKSLNPDAKPLHPIADNLELVKRLNFARQILTHGSSGREFSILK